MSVEGDKDHMVVFVYEVLDMKVTSLLSTSVMYDEKKVAAATK